MDIPAEGSPVPVVVVLGIGSTDTRAGKGSCFQEAGIRGLKDIAWKGTQAAYSLECSEDLKDTRTDRDRMDSDSQAGHILLAEKGKAPKQYHSLASARTSPQYD